MAKLRVVQGGWAWAELTKKEALSIWGTQKFEMFRLYDDGSEGMITDDEDFLESLENFPIGIELGDCSIDSIHSMMSFHATSVGDSQVVNVLTALAEEDAEAYEGCDSFEAAENVFKNKAAGSENVLSFSSELEAKAYAKGLMDGFGWDGSHSKIFIQQTKN